MVSDKSAFDDWIDLFREWQKVIGVDGLGQKVHRAFLHGGYRILDAAVGRHHDHRDVRVEFLGRAQHPKTVSTGKAQIRQHDHRPRLAQRVRRVRLVTRLDDGIPVPF